MSNSGGRRSEAGGAEDRFDLAIDRAVREMLDVEPPPGLRGRVLDGIERSPDSVASAFRRKIFWIAMPVAAAAILALAVLLPSTTDTALVAPVVKGGADHRLAVTPPPQAPQIAPAVQTPVVTARSVTRPAANGQAVAAVAPDAADADVVWIDALAPPAAMAVAAIEPGRGSAIPSIDLAPAQIPALEIRPISDTPRERRNQE